MDDPVCQEAGAATAQALRAAGIATDLYLGSSKLKAQFKYADAKGIPWVAVIGPSEANNGTVKLKDLKSGEQHTLDMSSLISHLRP